MFVRVSSILLSNAVHKKIHSMSVKNMGASKVWSDDSDPGSHIENLSCSGVWRRSTSNCSFSSVSSPAPQRTHSCSSALWDHPWSYNFQFLRCTNYPKQSREIYVLQVSGLQFTLAPIANIVFIKPYRRLIVLKFSKITDGRFQRFPMLFIQCCCPSASI